MKIYKPSLLLPAGPSVQHGVLEQLMQQQLVVHPATQICLITTCGISPRPHKTHLVRNFGLPIRLQVLFDKASNDARVTSRGITLCKGPLNKIELGEFLIHFPS